MRLTIPPAVVGRLAPSPTGGLHLGHARTFLIAWLAARHAGGSIILRIEDLDATRVRAEATDTALADLRWLGLDWDLGPFVQSRAGSSLRPGPGPPQGRRARLSLHLHAGRHRAGRQRPARGGRRADLSRNLLAAAASRMPPRWAIVPSPGGSGCREGLVSWNDLFLGRSLWEIRLAWAATSWSLGNGLGPSYQLAVVVDDALMGVNQVIRGDDLVPSTPRQILLYQALGWTPPQFGHVPLAVTPDGRRLAKRDGSIKLATLREQGVDPRRSRRCAGPSRAAGRRRSSLRGRPTGSRDSIPGTCPATRGSSRSSRESLKTG